MKKIAASEHAKSRNNRVPPARPTAAPVKTGAEIVVLEAVLDVVGKCSVGGT